MSGAKSFATDRMLDAVLDDQDTISSTPALGHRDDLLGTGFTLGAATGASQGYRVASDSMFETILDGQDSFIGTEGNDSLTGTPGNDTIQGLGGDDRLQGLNGDDTLDGGAGFDTASYTASMGRVNVNLAVSGAQNTGAGRDTLISIEGLIGSGYDDLLIGDAGNNRLDGGFNIFTGAAHDDYADFLQGGPGDDFYIADGIRDVVFESKDEGFDTRASFNDVRLTPGAHVEAAQLLGTANTSAFGDDLPNTLTGNSGNNDLDGRGGVDIMQGGLGNDRYFLSEAGDITIEEANAGFDTIVTTDIAIDLRGRLNLEGGRLDPNGSANLALIGNGADNLLSGNGGDNYISGQGGVDTMIGNGGNDTYEVDSTDDMIIETMGSYGGIDSVQALSSYFIGENIENLRLFGTAVRADGNSTANTIEGNDFANVIDGRGGADLMIGYGGDDLYIVDNSSDTIIESRNNGGIDSVQATVSYTLADAVENLRVFGGGNLSLDGNAQANVLEGNEGANRIDGHGGADTMIGYGGNDIYVVDNPGDYIVEAPGGGNDSAQVFNDYILPDAVENLRVFGTGNFSLDGNAQDNVIEGNEGNNRIDGHAGADYMIGYGGNDIYVVDNSSDYIFEAAGGGIDAVQSTVSYVLPADIENLRVFGSADLSADGNAQNNTIEGNSGNNYIDGRLGVDLMIGYQGNDTYVIDTAGDTIIEGANEGIDSVQSSISYALTENVENLKLFGGNINGTGNALANIIEGTNGANVLDGGGGVDTLFGYGGDDTYIVDDFNENVRENANEGIDTIVTSLNYTLGANFENLRLVGNENNRAIGNELANVIVGNKGSNAIDGKGGADTITGGEGVDTFVFTSALNGVAPRITDFYYDRFFLDDAIFTAIGTGDLHPDAFVVGAQAVDANDRIIYNRATGDLLYDADGNGAAAAVVFARLDAQLDLISMNFTVF